MFSKCLINLKSEQGASHMVRNEKMSWQSPWVDNRCLNSGWLSWWYKSKFLSSQEGEQGEKQHSDRTGLLCGWASCCTEHLNSVLVAIDLMKRTLLFLRIPKTSPKPVSLPWLGHMSVPQWRVRGQPSWHWTCDKLCYLARLNHGTTLKYWNIELVPWKSHKQNEKEGSSKGKLGTGWYQREDYGCWTSGSSNGPI